MARNTDTPADVAARQARGEAAAAPPDDAQRQIRPSRQAIVIVHGQGQQRPMGTMRDFVRTLWITDHRLKPPVAPDKERDIWVVPDGKSGLLDLERITTEAADGRKTDFFELYYADLLDDTPFRKLWRWMQRLLWISPNDVTPAMRWPWSLFWMLNIIVATIAIAFGLYLPMLAGENLIAPLMRPEAMLWLVAAFVLVVLRLLPKFIPPVPGLRWLVNLLEKLPNMLVLLAVGIALTVVFWTIPSVWLGAALGLLYYVGTTTFLPLFGDAASYLSAQSETVAPRQAVRERGLALLMALHDDPAYDRVVLVAHSLGTVLAYDLLTFMWHAVGPTKENPPDAAAADAIDAVDRHAAAIPPHTPWPLRHLRRYRKLQWAAFDILRRQPTRAADGSPRRAGWKISDFVSLGSPLASAQFLVTDGSSEFAMLKEQRVMPTSPPVRYDSANYASTYPEAGGAVAHHAAVFSVVRWTNIYDRFNPVLVLIGDVISGVVGGEDRFGAAIYDRRVRIDRGGLFGRFVTHNDYWTDTSGTPGAPAAHIRALRRAVDIAAGQ
ncbi:MAG: hypothetical protein EOP22_11090 [Hyphomicrobiales bacterium]|nr:MAG: hypothetical protein EOP22_11090 [Hyphomicrobiales bacterium]